MLKDLSKNESETITTIVQLGGLPFVDIVLESCKAFNPVNKLHQIFKQVAALLLSKLQVKCYYNVPDALEKNFNLG